jgi:WD40 repeat protein
MVVGGAFMGTDEDSRELGLLSMPDDDFMIKSLAPQRFVQASQLKEYDFLKNHILLEIRATANDSGGEGPPGGRPKNMSTALYVYDGNRLTALEGPAGTKTLGDMLHAEAVNLDQMNAHELAKLFNRVTLGGHQIVFYRAADQKGDAHTLAFCLEDRSQCDEAMSTLANPSIEGSAKGGWKVHFSAVRMMAGCTPHQPHLLKYIFSISPQFEVTYQEKNQNLQSKYDVCPHVYATKTPYGDREIKALIAALSDDYSSTRSEAINALRELGSAAAPAVPAMIQCLRDKDKYDCLGYKYSVVELQLVGTLCQIVRKIAAGPVVKSATPALIPYLFDKKLRYMVIGALIHARPDPGVAATIIEVIEKMRVEGPGQYVRVVEGGFDFHGSELKAMFHLLRFLDPPAQSVIPYLEEIANTDKDLRPDAFTALQAIRSALGTKHGEDAVSFHIRNLTSQQGPDVVLDSLSALAGLNPLPEEVWPAFIELLSDPSPSTRRNVVRVINTIGPAAHPLLPELLGFGKSPHFEGFRCPDGYGQDRFYKTIAKIDPSGKLTIPYLQKALSDPSQSANAIQLLLRIGSPQCRELVKHLEGPLVYSVAFSPDGGTLASSGAGGIRLSDVPSGREDHIIARGSGNVYSLAYSPDGRTLACSYLMKPMTIKLWDVASDKEIATYSGQSMGPTKIAFTHDWHKLAGANRNFTITVWDLASGKASELPALAATHMVSALAFSPDGRTLASGGRVFTDGVTLRPDGSLQQAMGGRGAIILWDVASAKAIRTLATAIPTDLGEVRSLAFNPDGRILASGGDGSMKLWDVASGEEIRTVYKSSGAVTAVAFSPDGRTLASTGYDSRKLGLVAGPSIKLWDMASGNEIRTLPGHQFGTVALAFSPGGSILASGGAGGIKLWDVASGRERLPVVAV